MNRDHNRPTAAASETITAGYPAKMAVSNIIVSGADRDMPANVKSTSQTNQDDLLQSFIVWNIETRRTSRHTVFSHWLCN
ncbi:hypothetical protein [Thalassospira marina]|uniref:Uncharacterized protein n=1 Tax=Thalassospira marina TaxID=2048283 RepID=A0A2N3KMV7_9PROT|nr:hypothetical protein [Thalassospira marina]AUG54515.1 hypothetical protein CSC3H3_18695 [Thalassospira marina]PKR51891.1 hypothetical protein COO20_17305 [Thalassospira marina]